MKLCVVLAVLVLWGATAEGFISKLNPMGNATGTGVIPCHQAKWAIFKFMRGDATGNQLKMILEREHLAPAGLTWSAEDDVDNANIVTLRNSITHATPEIQRLLRESVAHDFEGACASAEHQYDEVATKKLLRQQINLPCNPQDPAGCP